MSGGGGLGDDHLSGDGSLSGDDACNPNTLGSRNTRIRNFKVTLGYTASGGQPGIPESLSSKQTSNSISRRQTVHPGRSLRAPAPSSASGTGKWTQQSTRSPPWLGTGAHTCNPRSWRSAWATRDPVSTPSKQIGWVASEDLYHRDAPPVLAWCPLPLQSVEPRPGAWSTGRVTCVHP